MNRSQIGTDRFTEGYNCAQSVFSALAEGSDISVEQAIRIAGNFGGGIVDSGRTCGAVTGVLMALGLRFGASSNDDYRKKLILREKTMEFLDRFEKEFGSLECSLLKNQFPDPSDPHKNCQLYVGRAIEIVEMISR